MKVRGLKSFISARYGDVSSGTEFECDGALAQQWADNGMVEILEADSGRYDTKVIEETPKPAPRSRKRATKA